jgi:hypothetical protein
MKTAIYIADGQFQVVLTPESEFERNVLGALGEKQLKTEINTGSFYQCQGGWIRESSADRSLIVRFFA